MKERIFLSERITHTKVKNFLYNKLRDAMIADIEIYRIPIGNKIIIRAMKPGVIRRLFNLKELQNKIEKEFGLENPLIEVEPVENPFLEPRIVAEWIAKQLARRGTRAYRFIAYRAMDMVLKSGALGVEIVMAGKLPGERGKKWRFKRGYIPKCGTASDFLVKEAFVTITLIPGQYGIRVRILPPVELPDQIRIREIPLERLMAELEEEGGENGPVQDKGAETEEQ